MDKGLLHTFRSRYLAVVGCTRGNSAAEFAIVLPMLLLMVLGTMQMSMLMYSYNVMVLAAGNTARAMAVCTITTTTDATTNIRYNSNLPPWVVATDWQITSVIGDPYVSVTIGVDPKKAAILSYVPFKLAMMTTAITMRKEPLAAGNGQC